MQILQPASFPLEQRRDLDALEGQLGQFCADRLYPYRLLAYNERCSMRAPIQRITAALKEQRQLEATVAPLLNAVQTARTGGDASEIAPTLRALPPTQQEQLATLIEQTLGVAAPWMDPHTTNTLHGALQALPSNVRALPQANALPLEHWQILAETLDGLIWPRPWLHEMKRFYEAIARDWGRSATYLLLTWEPPEVRPESLRDALQIATGRSVSIRDQLPPVLRGRYKPPYDTYLEPREAGHPYLSTLFAYDVQGTWDAGTLHSLMSAQFDLAIAVDIQSVPRHVAMRSAELTFAGTKALLSDAQIKDAAAERRNAAAEQLLHALTHQGWHQVQIAVLVSGADKDQLQTHIDEVKARCGSQLSLTQIKSAYAQKEALQFWSTTTARAIDVPRLRRNMLSKGVGCCMGLLGYHRTSSTEGQCWGLDAVRLSPLFFNLFKDNQAAHQIILGMTGHGKTVFLNTIAMRSASEGMRVIGLDAFRNGDRVQHAAQAGAQCFSLGIDTPINLLDVVYQDNDDDVPGAWLGRQVQHVISQLALLFGDPGVNHQGKACYIPRRLSSPERGVLERALLRLYRAWQVTPQTPLNQMPILRDLFDVLQAIKMPEAQALARDLAVSLWGAEHPDEGELNVRGVAFNAHTKVNWDFTCDITYYDFQRVPDPLKAFYYVLAIGAVKRWMSNPRRDRGRKTLLQFDEFGYASQVEAVMQLAVEIAKTARKYGVGLMLIDQNPVTFLGNDQGRQIFENAAAVISFRLQDIAARQLGEVISVMTPEHVGYLMQAPPGHYVAAIGQDVYIGSNQLNAREHRFLVGS